MGNDRDLDPCAAMAAKLDGHDRRDFDTVVDALGDEAKAAGLVIVFGASDDGMVLRGVIDDKVGAYDAYGAVAWITDGKLVKGDYADCVHCRQAFELTKADAIEIRAYWEREVEVDGTYPVKYPDWSYELANGPDPASFTILDDGEPWCAGIVFPVAGNDASAISAIMRQVQDRDTLGGTWGRIDPPPILGKFIDKPVDDVREDLVALATDRAKDSSEAASILAAYRMGQEDARAERYRPDAEPEGLDALIAALQIVRTYGNPRDPTRCSHDVLWICGIDPEDVSAEDVARLEGLCFDVSDDGAFHSYRFGSA